MRDLMMSHKGRWVAMAAEHEITPQQMGALHLIEPDTPVPMSDLAQSLHCDASNVTGIVDRLEARGLVERRAAPHDRRVKMIALTDEGSRVRDALHARMSQPPDALAGLPPDDQRTLRDILRRALG
jgi:DNA-binding MarR family transcriptional regulator